MNVWSRYGKAPDRAGQIHNLCDGCTMSMSCNFFIHLQSPNISEVRTKLSEITRAGLAANGNSRRTLYHMLKDNDCIEAIKSTQCLKKSDIEGQNASDILCMVMGLQCNDFFPRMNPQPSSPKVASGGNDPLKEQLKLSRWHEQPQVYMITRFSSKMRWHLSIISFLDSINRLSTGLGLFDGNRLCFLPCLRIHDRVGY